MNSIPLEFVAQSAALKAWCRIKNNSYRDWEGITTHAKRRPLAQREWMNDKLTTLDIRGVPIDKATRRGQPGQQDQERRSSRKLRRLFTDASRKQKPNGIGIITKDSTGNTIVSSSHYVGNMLQRGGCRINCNLVGSARSRKVYGPLTNPVRQQVGYWGHHTLNSKEKVIIGYQGDNKEIQRKENLKLCRRSQQQQRKWWSG